MSWGVVVALRPRLEPRVPKCRVLLTDFVPAGSSTRFVLVRVAIFLGYSLACHVVMKITPSWRDGGIRTDERYPNTGLLPE
jgi:hypothetical protein